ncbi:MAG: Flp pilus assembly protein CpaB [Alphaproteobacteria bacterium]|nr:Flp pilus assembly protein CpaB [Alphaproteobacteria bacterium]
MNKNVLIVLAGGFLIAVLVAVMVQSMLGGSKKEEIGTERIEILVAAKKLKTGHNVGNGDLKWQIWPEDAVFTGAVIRDGEQQPTEAAKGKLLRPLEIDQPLHMSMLVEEDQGDFLSANIQKGMRGVGISVKSAVLADRLIRPGDFVDVLVTYQVRVNTRDNPDAQNLVNRYATETVIQNVRVLAVDSDDKKAIDEEETNVKKKKSATKAIVTLEVTPEAAEKLVLSNKMGEIGLALRSIGDNANVADDNTTTDVGMSRVMTDLSLMRETTSGIRIYNGIEMNEVQGRNPRPEQSVNFDVQSNEPQPVINLDPATLEGLVNEEQ